MDIHDQLHILLNNPLAYVQGTYQQIVYRVTAQAADGTLTLVDAEGPAFDQVDPVLLQPLEYGFPAISQHTELVADYHYESASRRWETFCRFMNWTDQTVITLLERPVFLTDLSSADYQALLCSMISL